MGRLTVQQHYDRIIETIKEEGSKIQNISDVLPFSRYDDCNASFTVYLTPNSFSMGINCSSVKKANAVKRLLEAYKKENEVNIFSPASL